MFTLDTLRLRLQPLTLADFDSIYRIWTEPEVRKFLWDDQIISPETALAAITGSIASFEANRFGIWGVIDKETQQLIGFCGCRFIEDSSEIELLYGISTRYWGKGLVTEAAQAVIRYMVEELSINRIVAAANPDNVGSYRVLEKLGFQFEKRTEVNGEKLLSYVLRR